MQNNQQVANLNQRTLVINALQQEATDTQVPHPPAMGGLDLSNPHVCWIVKNPGSHLGINAAAFNAHWSAVPAPQQVALQAAGLDPNNAYSFANSYNARVAYDAGPRFGHHEHKSASRLATHFNDLANRAAHNTPTGDPVPSYVTESRGEHTAAKVLMTCLGDDNYQLKLGYRPGGHPGSDQIWAKRDRNTGQINEYYIVEAKGSHDAHLQLSVNCAQMSSAWVFDRLFLLWALNGRERRLAEKILLAMFDDNAVIPVNGLTIKDQFGNANNMWRKVIDVQYYGPYYNRPDLP